MSYLDIASAYKDCIHNGFSRSQQRFYCLSNRLDFMASDLQPMYALTFGSVLVLSYHIACRLVSTGLYCYIIIIYHHQPIAFISLFTSSIRIYIGHIADSSKPYRYRLVSASAGITPSACQPIGSLICYLYILSVARSN